MLYSNINSSNIELMIQLFSTLNEFVSGNQANRYVILNCKVVDFINFIIRTGQFDDCSHDQVGFQGFVHSPYAQVLSHVLIIERTASCVHLFSQSNKSIANVLLYYLHNQNSWHLLYVIFFYIMVVYNWLSQQETNIKNFYVSLFLHVCTLWWKFCF